MIFLAPAFLYGLVALAIPIIIHLFQFRRAREVAYSNIRLLQHVRKQTGRKRKLKQLFILFFRLLAIAFLVVAFAQPFIPAKEQGLGSEKVDIYLDNSYSMSATDERGRSLLQNGIELSERLIRSLPAGTQYRLLTNDFLAESQYYTSAEAIRRRLAELSYSQISRRPDEIVQRMAGQDRTAEGAVQFFWISDLQAEEPSAVATLFRGDSLHSYTLFPMEFAQAQNVFVDTLYLDQPILREGSQTSVKLRISNTGDEDILSLPLQLLLNGRQVASLSVDLPAGERQTAEMPLPPGISGLNVGEIRFEDFPITFDNSFYFVLRAAGQINIVHLLGSAKQETIPAVFSDEDLFALQTYTPDNVPYEAIREADLLILESLSAPDNALLQVLQEYVQADKHVLFIPNITDNSWWNILLTGMQVEAAKSVQVIRILPPDPENPFYAQVFEERVRPGGMPEARPSLSWRGQYQKILELSNGRPFFSRNGNQFFLAAPLQNEANAFARHAIFVPSMYKIAFGSLRTESPLYIQTGTQTVSLLSDSLNARIVYQLIKDGMRVIPGQRVSGRRLLFDLPAYTLSPGTYKLTTQQDTTQLLDMLAVNYPPQESELKQAAVNEWQALAESMPGLRVLEVDELLEESEAALNRNFKGEALWKWAVLVVLLSLLAEIMLIRFWK